MRIQTTSKEVLFPHKFPLSLHKFFFISYCLHSYQHCVIAVIITLLRSVLFSCICCLFQKWLEPWSVAWCNARHAYESLCLRKCSADGKVNEWVKYSKYGIHFNQTWWPSFRWLKYVFAADLSVQQFIAFSASPTWKRAVLIHWRVKRTSYNHTEEKPKLTL